MTINHVCEILESNSPDDCENAAISPTPAYAPPEPNKVKDEMAALLAPVLAQHNKRFNDMLEQLFKT